MLAKNLDILKLIKKQPGQKPAPTKKVTRKKCCGSKK